MVFELNGAGQAGQAALGPDYRFRPSTAWKGLL